MAGDVPQLSPAELELATGYVAALIRAGWIPADQPPRSIDFAFVEGGRDEHDGTTNAERWERSGLWLT